MRVQTELLPVAWASSPGKPHLYVADIGHRTALEACLRWHYSSSLPSGKLERFGIWENEGFVGAVLYGYGSTPTLFRPYGIGPHEGRELARVALAPHQSPTSQIIAMTLRLLKMRFPALRLVVSFADPSQGHHGGIYQAGNWIYTGLTQARSEFIVNGSRIHARTLQNSRNRQGMHGITSLSDWLMRIDPGVKRVPAPRRHRYIYPLDREMRRQLAVISRPYPRR